MHHWPTLAQNGITFFPSKLYYYKKKKKRPHAIFGILSLVRTCLQIKQIETPFVFRVVTPLLTQWSNAYHETPAVYRRHGKLEQSFFFPDCQNDFSRKLKEGPRIQSLLNFVFLLNFVSVNQLFITFLTTNPLEVVMGGP